MDCPVCTSSRDKFYCVDCTKKQFSLLNEAVGKMCIMTLCNQITKRISSEKLQDKLGSTKKKLDIKLMQSKIALLKEGIEQKSKKLKETKEHIKKRQDHLMTINSNLVKAIERFPLKADFTDIERSIKEYCVKCSNIKIKISKVLVDTFHISDIIAKSIINFKHFDNTFTIKIKRVEEVQQDFEWEVLDPNPKNAEESLTRSTAISDLLEKDVDYAVEKILIVVAFKGEYSNKELMLSNTPIYMAAMYVRSLCNLYGIMLPHVIYADVTIEKELVRYPLALNSIVDKESFLIGLTCLVENLWMMRQYLKKDSPLPKGSELIIHIEDLLIA